jgi:hypothetical protein
LDIGFSGINMIETYYKNSKSSIVFSEEIKMLHNQITELERINREIKKQKNSMEEEKYDDILKLRKEMETTYLNKIEKLNNEVIETKQEKNSIEEDKHTDILKLRKEMETTYLNKIEKLNNEVIETKNTYMEKIYSSNENLQKKFFTELTEIKQEKNKEIEYFKKMLDENQSRSEENVLKETTKIENEKNKIIEGLEKENQKYRNKYEKLELKSVKKGKPYEDAIEDELREYFVIHGKTYCLERCSTMKGKGDFVVTNNYSGLRIMLEAKNMPSVSSTVKDQLPKFYDNINDKINLYDGGIVIAIQNIESKKNYDIEVLPNNKVVSFIENYTLNSPERIYSMIEMLHKKITELRSGNTLSRNQVLNDKVEDYKNIKDSFNKLKIAYDQQSLLMIKMKENILNLFDVDVDEYILNMKNSEKSTKGNISDKIREFIKIQMDENPIIKDAEIKNAVNSEFKDYIDLYEKKKDRINGVSKRQITIIIKNLKKGKKIVERNMNQKVININTTNL